jgi:glycosyltransferase involved in cell wall biosynthesis
MAGKEFDMPKISVVIPCYNDGKSIAPMYERLRHVFAQLSAYDYEIIYADDCSPDNTWSEVGKLCAADKRVKGIHNMRNFGFYRNVFMSMKYGDGDATFMIFGDLQDPPEVLPEFVEHWEKGHRVVVGARSNSYDKYFIRVMRKAYYKIITRLSNNRQIEGINGFGIYDRRFVDILRDVDDIQPFLPGIITEYVRDIKIIPTRQEKGGRGRSNWNFWGKYDGAMISITSYTKSLLRAATFLGILMGILSILFAFFVFIYKFLFWDVFTLGIPVLIVGLFFFGAVQLFFLGILGEYVLSINNRSMKRPLVVVDEKLNFDSTREGEKPGSQDRNLDPNQK